MSLLSSSAPGLNSLFFFSGGRTAGSDPEAAAQQQRQNNGRFCHLCPVIPAAGIMTPELL